MYYPCSVRIAADQVRYTDPFAEADEDTGETRQSQNYIHIRIQRMFAAAITHLWAVRALGDR